MGQPTTSEPRPTRSVMGRALARLTSLAETLAAIAIGIIVVLVTYEVLARYVFIAPTIWTQDVCIYLLLLAAFLGMAPAERAGDHISVDLAVSKLRPRAQAILRAIICVGAAGFFALVAWTGLEASIQSYTYGRRSLSLLSIPMWIPQLCVPVGMTLLTAEALRRAWLSIAQARGTRT